MRRLFHLAVVMACLSVFVTYWFSSTPKGAAAPVPVQALGVGCLGRITPGQRVLRLTFPPQTILKTVLVKRQEWVKANAILALAMEHDLAAADLERARQEVAVSASQLSQLEAGEKRGALAAQEATVTRDKAEVANRQKVLAREEALFDRGIVSQAELDEARYQDVAAEKNLDADRHHLASMRDIRPIDLASAQHRLQASEASLQVAQARVELNVLRAPCDGQVLAINTYPGEAVGSTGVVDFAETSALQVEAEVHIGDIARVQVGSAARLRCEGIPEELEGTVTEIAPTLHSSSLFDPNPLASSDLRVITIRIQVKGWERLQKRINAQVIVRILP